mgnify:CR=1 FL=1
MKKYTNILDCTLRDGGYYTNWFFDKDLVNNYLHSTSKAKIKFIELGFRFKDSHSHLGPYAFSNDSYLSKLNLQKNQTYAVMINGSEYLYDTKSLINKKFDKKINSPISLIRVAINIDKAIEAKPIVTILKNLGYSVALNLMQPQDKNSIFLKDLSNHLYNWKIIDLLYFADSLGCLNTTDIKFIVDAFSNNWKNKFGIHAHNNRSLALINTLEAINNEVYWCDSTICGMGRGAGNLETEILITELKNLNKHPGSSFMLKNILDSFEKLKTNYKWGPNISYHYAANNNIHPSYVQTLISEKKYQPDEVNSILTKLANEKSNSYIPSKMNIFYSKNKISFKGSWDPYNKFKKNCVLIAASDSTFNNHIDINTFLNNFNADFFSINYIECLDKKKLKAIISANPTRIFFDLKKKNNLITPIITPKELARKTLGEKITNFKILNYGFEISKLSSVDKFSSKIKNNLSLEYALSILSRSNVKNVYLIGFEGFNNIKKNNIINDIFKTYNSKYKINFVSLTPTRYQVNTESLYSYI